MLNVTNGNNTLQGLEKKGSRARVEVGGFSLFCSATKAFTRGTGRGSSALYFHMPCPIPRWGTREVFFGRCLGGGVWESTSLFQLGLGEMSSFVKVTLATKLVGSWLLREAGTICISPLLHNLLFPLAAIPGWQ